MLIDVVAAVASHHVGDTSEKHPFYTMSTTYLEAVVSAACAECKPGDASKSNGW
jgi:hypothetical protein